MKLFLNYLRNFLKEDFHPGYYSGVFLLLTAAISVNYWIDLEDGIIDQIDPYPLRAVGFFALYGGLYFSVLLINRLLLGPNAPDLSRQLWINSLFVLMLLSADIAFQPSEVTQALPKAIRYFTGNILNNFIGILTALIPFYLFIKWVDKDQESLYGLTRKGFVPNAYYQLFLLVIPLVIIGSFLPGFDKQYPMYPDTRAHLFWEIPQWVTIIAFELAYGWNFVVIELVFRGFLVIGMVKVLGRHAVLPMAVVYCSIHFGKPMGEAISSIFGGYFLGVIAYYSRNIWGGVAIHLGLAWLMELVSFLQKVFS